MNEEESSLFDVLWLLLASVIFVPIFQKLPGGESIHLGPKSASTVYNNNKINNRMGIFIIK